jgi:hypothetical protein
MSVHAPLDRQVDSPHGSIRMDARLDTATRHKVDDFARYSRRVAERHGVNHKASAHVAFCLNPRHTSTHSRGEGASVLIV